MTSLDTAERNAVRGEERTASSPHTLKMRGYRTCHHRSPPVTRQRQVNLAVVLFVRTCHSGVKAQPRLERFFPRRDEFPLDPPPPCTKSITGASGVGAARTLPSMGGGPAKTLRLRHCSRVGGITIFGCVVCGQHGPKFVASRRPPS